MTKALDNINNWIQNNRLNDPDDIDALLETADLTRLFISGRNYAGINTIILYTIENSLYEAFTWIISLLEEEFEKTAEYDLNDFTCEIGGSIPE